MWKIFEHHVSKWALLQLLADWGLCFLITTMALQQFPALMADLAPTSDVMFKAAGFAALVTLLNAFLGLYRDGATPVRAGALVGRSTVSLLLCTAISFTVLKTDGHYDLLALVAGYVVVLTGMAEFGIRGLGQAWHGTERAARRVLIVGTDETALSVALDLAAMRRVRHTVVGFYPTGSGGERHVTAACVPGAQVFGADEPLVALLASQRVDEIVVAEREHRNGNVPIDQLLACRCMGVPVLDLAGLFERVKGEVRAELLKPSYLVYGGGFEQGLLRTTVKRAFDIATALLLLILTAPVLVVAAAAIKLESPGPLLYRQERVGWRGRSFMCIKLRSMHVDAESDGVARWAQANDPRVTRVGALMRKMRIDELPQLYSVLVGDMSLVGPRPERPAFVEQLRRELPYYDLRHSVKPGITGWAQVRYSYGATVEDARRKHQYDLYYVKHHCLFLDLLVLVETVSVVLFREGAR